MRNIAIYFTNTFFKGFLLFVWIAGLPIWKKEARSTKAAVSYTHLSEFTKEDLSDRFYGTTWSKAALFDAKPDTVSVYRPNFDIGYKVNYVYESKQSDSMYEPAWLDKKDKYSVFFDGNHPVVTVDTTCLLYTSGRVFVADKNRFPHCQTDKLCHKIIGRAGKSCVCLYARRCRRTVAAAPGKAKTQ